MRRPAARQASATFGTLHREVIVGTDQIGEAIPKVVWHLEDPIARSETVQLYETVRTAAGHVDAMFGGFVADALYAGMPRHKLVRMAEVLPFLQPTLGEFYQFTQSGTRPKTLPGKLLVGGYFRGRRPVAPRVVGTSTALYLAPWPFDHKGASAEALNVYLRDGLHSSVPQWLPKVDRLVFAYGIPFFSPFMDPSVIRQAFRIPGSHKIRFWQEKYVFRQAMAPLVPRGLLARRKFPQRMLYDLSFSDALDVLADEVLSRSHVKARGFFDWQDLCRLRRRPTNKPYSAEHGMHIWTALLTEVWARLFVDGRGAAPERSFRYDPWFSDESDLRRTC